MSTSTMIAYQYDREAPPGEVLKREVPVPVPGDEEVLIEVKAAGLCHSDLHVVDAKPPNRLPGKFTLSHEIAGVPISTGSLVPPNTIKLGTLYALYSTNPCLSSSCPECSSGLTHVCSSLSRAWLGLGANGGFAKYTVIHWRHLVLVPQGVSPAVAAVTTDAVLTPWHSIRTIGKIREGQTVLIIGLGGLGSNAVQVAKYSGAVVIATDKKKETVDYAKADLGIEHAVVVDELEGYLQSKGLRVDVVLDLVVVNETVALGAKVIKRGGTIIATGLGAPQLGIGTSIHSFKEIRLQSTFWGTRDELEEALAAVAQGKIQPLVHTAPMDDLLKNYEELRSGKIKGRMAFIP